MLNLARGIAGLTLVWQTVFLVGAVEMAAKIQNSKIGNITDFGFLWPGFLWGLSMAGNLGYL